MPRLQLAAKTAPRLYGRLKLARLLTLSEGDFEKDIRRIEADALFVRLKEFGVVSVAAYPRARFFERRLKGWELKRSSVGLGDLLGAQAGIVALIERVGRERFEECFVRDDGPGLAPEECARRCGITLDEARLLRDFMTRVYIRSEFEESGGPPLPPSPAAVYSAVAGV
jgi:hypothetical protein